MEDENYLRGVQELDASGTATFTSIFPAAYSGRWPHIHFEVYSDVANAVSSGPIVKTSQIALPKEACDAVYATAGYEQSVRNLAQTSLQQDRCSATTAASTRSRACRDRRPPVTRRRLTIGV